MSDKTKYYLIEENDLREILVGYFSNIVLERDGVDNWCWYMESRNEFIQEFFPDKKKREIRENYNFYDCADEFMKEYKYIEVDSDEKIHK